MKWNTNYSPNQTTKCWWWFNV